MRIGRISPFDPSVSSLSGFSAAAFRTAEETDLVSDSQASRLEMVPDSAGKQLLARNVPSEDAVVVDIDFAAVRQAAAQFEQAAGSVAYTLAQEGESPVRPADFLAASAGAAIMPALADSETEEPAQVDRLAVLENTANISRIGSETASTRPEPVFDSAETGREPASKQPVQPLLAVREQRFDTARSNGGGAPTGGRAADTSAADGQEVEPGLPSLIGRYNQSNRKRGNLLRAVA